MRLGEATRKRKRPRGAWLIAGALFVFSIVTLGVGVFHTSTAPVPGSSARLQSKRSDNHRSEHGKGIKTHGGKTGRAGRKRGSRRAGAPEAPPPAGVLPDVPTASEAAYVLATFKDNKVLGDGLRFLVSTDGLQWDALGPDGDEQVQLRREDIPGARVFRDPSLLFHDGWFHLVFSSELCVYQVHSKAEIPRPHAIAAAALHPAL